MLDALGGDARRMNAQVLNSEPRLGVMNEALEESRRGPARQRPRAAQRRLLLARAVRCLDLELCYTSPAAAELVLGSHSYVEII